MRQKGRVTPVDWAVIFMAAKAGFLPEETAIEAVVIPTTAALNGRALEQYLCKFRSHQSRRYAASNGLLGKPCEILGSVLLSALPLLLLQPLYVPVISSTQFCNNVSTRSLRPPALILEFSKLCTAQAGKPIFSKIFKHLASFFIILIRGVAISTYESIQRGPKVSPLVPTH